MRYDKVELQGKFWIQRVSTAAGTKHKSVIDEGRLVYDTGDEHLYFGGLTDWKKVAGQYDVFTALTTTLFGKWPLPLGWNIVSKDDVMIHVTSSSALVNSYEGGWTITGIDTQGSHDHGGWTGTGIGSFRIGDSNAKSKRAPLIAHLHSIPPDGLHTHGFTPTWRPAYIKFVEGVLS